MDPLPVERSCMVLVLALIAIAMPSSLLVGADGLTVSISQPWPDDIVVGNVSVRGSASADALMVEVRVDSGNWSGASGIPAWAFIWDSTGYADGRHVIEARSVNGSRTSPIASVSIVLNNTQPGSISFNAGVDPSAPLPGGDVHVSGMAEFDSGAKLAGATVTMKMDTGGAGQEWQAITDDRGFFERVIKAPLDDGDHLITLEASARGATGHEEHHIMVSSPYHPDLSVDNVTVTPGMPRAGENSSFEVFVSNTGNAVANCTVRYYMDGKSLRSEKVTIDKSYYGSLTWSAVPGDHLFEVSLDDIEPTDSDALDDKGNLRFNVLHRPDLAIRNIVFSNPAPEDGASVTVKIGLQNLGEVAAMGKVRVYKDVIDGKALIGDVVVDVPGNETEDIYVKWDAEEGRHQLVVVANITDDQDPTNDQATSEPIVVAAAPEKKGGEEVPGVYGMLAVLAMVLMVAVLSRRGSAP